MWAPWPGQPVFNVLDYKSGAASPLRPEDIEAGVALQLPLYVMAVEAVLLAGQGSVPWRAAYWFIREAGYREKRALAMAEPDGDSLRASAQWESDRGEGSRADLPARARYSRGRVSDAQPQRAMHQHVRLPNCLPREPGPRFAESLAPRRRRIVTSAIHTPFTEEQARAIGTRDVVDRRLGGGGLWKDVCAHRTVPGPSRSGASRGYRTGRPPRTDRHHIYRPCRAGDARPRASAKCLDRLKTATGAAHRSLARPDAGVGPRPHQHHPFLLRLAAAGPTRSKPGSIRSLR